jgi:hypothetical protein
MPVQAGAFVPLGNIRKAMGRLDVEDLEDMHRETGIMSGALRKTP